MGHAARDCGGRRGSRVACSYLVGGLYFVTDLPGLRKESWWQDDKLTSNLDQGPNLGPFGSAKPFDSRLVLC